MKTDTQYSDENQRVQKGKDITMTELQKKLCSEEKEVKVDTYLPVLDMLCTELSRRLEAYREINNLLGFLTDFSTKSDAEIRQACTNFKEHYFEDIEPEFIDEMVQYKYFILQVEDAGKKIIPAEESYKLIIGNMAQSTFPNGPLCPPRLTAVDGCASHDTFKTAASRREPPAPAPAPALKRLNCFAAAARACAGSSSPSPLAESVARLRTLSFCRTYKMAAPLKKFTRKELETHSNKNDALFVIDNVVYDVTKFLDEHPGGHEVLLERAGKDASEGFEDVGHSSDAKELMVKYRVGEVVDEDKQEVRRRTVSWDSSKEEGSSSGGSWNTWLVPVALGILATIMYQYLFA
ncbi:Cytochrome b5 [Eumeta japonica]|uniref:Cytochrome b5 n=1 Tax=Eumeta variegata TaxID=151549 RepID=A0A4C1UFY6_EUMVA|nr:Cytochrome b5 [Eumeta japonica]